MMKRITVSALAMLMAAGLACAAEVESQNIVGYKTLDITGGKLNMLAVNWDKVQGGDIAIQDLLGDDLASGLVGGSGLLNSDTLLVWDAASSCYTQYFLYNSGGVYTSWDGKWVKYRAAPAKSGVTQDSLPLGQGAWLKSIGAGWTLSLAKPY
jgi:hypothetical protein